MSKTWNVDTSFRLGRIIRENFMPFLRMGFRYDHYNMRPSENKRNHFGAGMMVYGVGVDAFADEKITIRSELNYAFCTAFYGNHNVSGKKLLNVALVMSVARYL